MHTHYSIIIVIIKFLVWFKDLKLLHGPLYWGTWEPSQSNVRHNQTMLDQRRNKYAFSL